MKNKYKDKTILFVDNGLFTSFAIKLSEFFGEVLYWNPWVSAFPKSNSMLIGDGLDEIKKIKYMWDYIDLVDLFVFPDVYFSDVQAHLKSLGKRVWGGGYGDCMELDRWGMKQTLKKIGLPVQPCKLITGMEDLRNYLKDNDNKYIKISLTRGDTETWHHVTYDLSYPKLDEMEFKLGAKSKIMKFIVEDAIDDAVEVGYDGWCIDGEFPKTGILGYEIKDAGLMAVVKKYDDLPDPVKYVNKKLSPLLKQYQYRGFFSTEIRYGKDEQPYLTDPCCRLGSPPSELYQEMYANWDDIIWEGSEGKIVDPIPTCKFGCEAMIHSPWADKNWQALYFPNEIKRWIKLRNQTQIDGKTYVVPQDCGLPEIGAIVAIDETMIGAINKVKDYSSKLEGYQIEVKLDSIPEALREIEEGEKKGIHFSDEMPTPEEVCST